jgi:hypothetical protein
VVQGQRRGPWTVRDSTPAPDGRSHRWPCVHITRFLAHEYHQARARKQLTNLNVLPLTGVNSSTCMGDAVFLMATTLETDQKPLEVLVTGHIFNKNGDLEEIVPF